MFSTHPISLWDQNLLCGTPLSVSLVSSLPCPLPPPTSSAYLPLFLAFLLSPIDGIHIVILLSLVEMEDLWQIRWWRCINSCYTFSMALLEWRNHIQGSPWMFYCPCKDRAQSLVQDSKICTLTCEFLWMWLVLGMQSYSHTTSRTETKVGSQSWKWSNILWHRDICLLTVQHYSCGNMWNCVFPVSELSGSWVFFSFLESWLRQYCRLGIFSVLQPCIAAFLNGIKHLETGPVECNCMLRNPYYLKRYG